MSHDILNVNIEIWFKSVELGPHLFVEGVIFMKFFIFTIKLILKFLASLIELSGEFLQYLKKYTLFNHFNYPRKP